MLGLTLMTALLALGAMTFSDDVDMVTVVYNYSAFRELRSFGSAKLGWKLVVAFSQTRPCVHAQGPLQASIEGQYQQYFRRFCHQIIENKAR